MKILGTTILLKQLLCDIKYNIVLTRRNYTPWNIWTCISDPGFWGKIENDWKAIEKIIEKKKKLKNPKTEKIEKLIENVLSCLK